MNRFTRAHPNNNLYNKLLKYNTSLAKFLQVGPRYNASLGKSLQVIYVTMHLWQSPYRYKTSL